MTGGWKFKGCEQNMHGVEKVMGRKTRRVEEERNELVDMIVDRVIEKLDRR